MKIKIVSMLQHERRHEAGHRQLIRSLEYFGYDFHVIDPDFRGRPFGFGDKLIGTAAYVETIRDKYTHFVFLDGTDTFALAGPDEMHAKVDEFQKRYIVISCEKALWPGQAEKFREIYAPDVFRWSFPNSGSYLTPIDLFLGIWKTKPVDYWYDDQLWFHERYAETGMIMRDRDCAIFQSIAFQADDEFSTTENRLSNLITGSLPVFIHGNGRTPMDWIYKLLP